MSKSKIQVCVNDNNTEVDMEVDTTNVHDPDKKLEIEKAAGDLAVKIQDILKS